MSLFVHITLPIGEATFPRAHADVFSVDTLTITADDDGHEMRVFQPEDWLDATAYEAHSPDDHVGYAIYTHRNGSAVLAIAKRDQQAAAIREGREALDAVRRSA